MSNDLPILISNFNGFIFWLGNKKRSMGVSGKCYHFSGWRVDWGTRGVFKVGIGKPWIQRLQVWCYINLFFKVCLSEVKSPFYEPLIFNRGDTQVINVSIPSVACCDFTHEFSNQFSIPFGGLKKKEVSAVALCCSRNENAFLLFHWVVPNNCLNAHAKDKFLKFIPMPTCSD